jgi:hypothetical protein
MHSEDSSEAGRRAQDGAMEPTPRRPRASERRRRTAVRRRSRGLAVAALAGVTLSAVVLEQAQPRQAEAAVLTATTPTIRPIGGSGLFGPGTQPRFTVTGVDRASDVVWRINDTTGTVVDSGTGRAGTRSVEVAPAAALPSGTYRLTVQGPGATTASVRFVRTVEGPGGSDPYFGLGVDPVSSALPTLEALGAGSHRQDLQWSAVEKVAGRFDFTATDARVDPIVQDLGISPLFVLDYGNVAYTNDPMAPPDMSKPAQAEGWKRYVRQTVSHMRERHPEADLSYEVWNEWTNNHGQLPATPAAYIELASVTAAVIRDADPAATIVGPTQNSVADSERDWLTEWFRLGGARHVDAVSVHPYTNPWAPEDCAVTDPCMEDSLAWLRRTADQHPRADGSALPIWITEVGWPTQFGGTGWVQPEDQTAYVLRTYAIAAKYGVERLFLFEMAEPASADPNGLARTFGLTGPAAGGYEPKTSAAGWATMQRVLAGKRFVAEHRIGDVRHMRFTSPDGKHHARVVWQSAEQHASTPVRVSLRGTGRIIEPTGSAKSVRGTAGKLDMSAKWIPRFVVWDE